MMADTLSATIARRIRTNEPQRDRLRDPGPLSRDPSAAGARITIANLDHRFGADPAVAVAIAELRDVGSLITPDAETVELTAKGFDAIQGGGYHPEND
jgi:hypothetical protein